MGLPPWETSESQTFALVTGANSGLGFAIAARLIDDFLTSSDTPPTKHLVLILTTRTQLKTRFTISRLRAHLRKLVDYSQFANALRAKAEAQGNVYKWQDMVARVHFLGVEVDLCDLKSIYAVTDRLVNGTIGSPDATTMDGLKLPVGSPGTASYSPDVQQDRWALSQKEGSDGEQRSWGWGLSGIRIPRLDVIVLNAGIGGWTGINWPKAVWTVLTDMTEAVTWPSYKLADVGAMTKPQLSVSSKSADSSDGEATESLTNGASPEEPPLGATFCSNVFGHYILAHELMPLLSRTASSSATASGRIIWVSSIEAQSQHLNVDDIQGLESHAPYESSKRLTDVLVLSRKLRAAGKASSSWFDCSDVRVKESRSSDGEDPKERLPTKLIRPKMYVVQPGIFVSEIMPLNFVLVFFYRMIFYLVRWMGSQWHTIKAYTAAVAPVWVALSPDEILDTMDAPASKWGSATDSSGKERVIRTEVPGWGWEGKTPKTIDTGERRKGRKRDAVPLTREAREDFEVLGVKCWTEMEKLRKEWEELLGVKK
ncbi:hypothetical protein DID88_008471 [Monilinia fructigena]|uniref:3-keto-steroid reductase n=1 Tax=Monilinia fructigena TaxID=38457 RepID=A0A395J6G8_9HELO|nr:hypothetical protein DID88_008471 [Monilinia fructigena]